MSIIFSSKALDYIENLIPILYEKGYFSFEDQAKRYIDELYDDIITYLPTRLSKPAPPYFDKYGKNMFYAIFKKNKNTSWYVFFKTSWKNDEEIYKVRHIANNHTVAQYL